MGGLRESISFLLCDPIWCFCRKEGDACDIEGKEVVGCSDITLSPPRWLLLNQEGLKQEFTNSETY